MVFNMDRAINAPQAESNVVSSVGDRGKFITSAPETAGQILRLDLARHPVLFVVSLGCFRSNSSHEEASWSRVCSKTFLLPFSRGSDSALASRISLVK